MDLKEFITQQVQELEKEVASIEEVKDQKKIDDAFEAIIKKYEQIFVAKMNENIKTDLPSLLQGVEAISKTDPRFAPVKHLKVGSLSQFTTGVGETVRQPEGPIKLPYLQPPTLGGTQESFSLHINNNQSSGLLTTAEKYYPHDLISPQMTDTYSKRRDIPIKGSSTHPKTIISEQMGAGPAIPSRYFNQPQDFVHTPFFDPEKELERNKEYRLRKTIDLLGGFEPTIDSNFIEKRGFFLLNSHERLPAGERVQKLHDKHCSSSGAEACIPRTSKHPAFHPIRPLTLSSSQHNAHCDELRARLQSICTGFSIHTKVV
eukprot:TRINITY_DN1457_c0_g1_i2.p1 TRINITY_DN1457_c0_g1~~TRINITY_DN1457_c0_g1_i2.p1  ORF type:complete len:317 (-),score=24.75 TRINITY_DN1457_c0_g1_i2:81-1031(-)